MCVLAKSTWLIIWASVTLAIWGAYIAVRAFVFPGTCPGIVEASNFDRTKYTGRWYEFARSESVPKEWEKCQCQTAFYEPYDP